MTSRSLTVDEVLHGSEPSVADRLEGPALVKMYWTLKGRARELARQKAFWETTNEALQDAYKELEEKTRELRETKQQLLQLNNELEQRVAAQVLEIVQRAQEVEALNAQLQLKVQERSRELMAALNRLDALQPKNEYSPGQVFADRVEILGTLGKGGMGVVYLGRDRVLQKHVALKVIRHVVSSVSIRRFLNEAAAASSIRHPGVVRSLHVDVTSGGHVYQIFEYVDGITLAHRLAQGPLPIHMALLLFIELADALAAAHDSGVVHRDIKPSNIILCHSAPSIRILDFGISKLVEGEESSNEMTRENESMGTPKYMSPEQVQNVAKVTSATDVYSLGITLFEAIAGRTPYKRYETPQDLLRAHLVEPPAELKQVVPDVPESLAAVVAQCLQKDPFLRPTARELTDMLRIILDDLKRDGHDFSSEATDPLAMGVTKTVIPL